jgi:transposase, IS30 family
MVYVHLRAEEREQISCGLARGLSERAIARALKRSSSTISREVLRHGSQTGYSAVDAQQRAQRLRRKPRRPRKLADRPYNRLRQQVIRKLRQHYAPQQIAGWLRCTYPNEPERWVSHQTIYTYIEILPKGEFKREVLRCLRHEGKVGSGQPRQNRPWVEQLIHERPEEASARRLPGHWEGDLLLGKAAGGAAVGVLLERVSRHIRLVKLERHDAYSTYQGFKRKLATVPLLYRKTLTYDQGSEMAEHARLTEQLGIQVYFCDPHSPWQRGGCENINGLLRQYLPKGMDMCEVTQRELEWIAKQLNDRPRKTLKWATPNEVWRAMLNGKSFAQAVALET